jgi:hypothetical protein
MNRAQALSQMRMTIVKELCVKRWLDVWFFPELDGVKGWRGTARIMFVGLNPSMGTFSSKADLMFYDTLRQNGLSEAHITDLYKTRLPGKSVTRSFAIPELEQLHKTWLINEVRLLKPYFIVALGHKTFGILQAWLPEHFHSRMVKIHHYSWAQRYRRNEVFAQDVAKIRDMYLTKNPIRQFLSSKQGVHRAVTA